VGEGGREKRDDERKWYFSANLSTGYTFPMRRTVAKRVYRLYRKHTLKSAARVRNAKREKER
jgi:uncharacterized protein YhjY with autotransporter beta-barrel domain